MGNAFLPTFYLTYGGQKSLPTYLAHHEGYEINSSVGWLELFATQHLMRHV
jgi:hypothetical protein